MKIYDLKINRMTSCVGIGWEAPLFSFLTDTEADFCAELYRDGGDTPEQTRRVTLGESSGFRFSKSLTAGRVYRFRVSAIENNGDHNVGTFAETTFETGIPFDFPFLTPSDPALSHPAFRRGFTVPHGTVRARLYITGLGLYRAKINGQRVGDAYLTPGCADYDENLYYQTYDVTDLLLHGRENELTVEMGDGWYRGRYGIDKQVDTGGKVWGDRYLLAAGLRMIANDGSENWVRTDERFCAAPSECRFDSIYDGEVREAPPKAESVPVHRVETDYRPRPQEHPAVRAVGFLTPTLLLSPKGEQILDFGQNFAGFVRFSGTFPAGTRIRLLHGEILQDGCFYNANLRTARAEAVYVSDGETRTYEPYFTYFGFRYALVEGIPVEDPAQFTGVVLSTDLPRTFAFSSDRADLVRLTENAWYGQLSNFIDIPTDCPQRDERLGWTADARVFAPTACRQADCYPFYQKYLRDLRAEQTRYYSGDLPMYAPSLRGEAGKGGAGWADISVELPWFLYETYGDKYLLEEFYPMMRDYADVLLDGIRADGGKLLRSGFTFGDWLALDGASEQSLRGATDDIFLKSAYACHALELTANAADVIGNAEDAQRVGNAAKRLRGAILSEYFTEEGRFALDTQTAYIVSLSFGLFSDRDRVISAFRERMRKDLYCLKSGFLGTPLALSAMYRNGMEEEAGRVLFRTGYPGWLYEVRQGATTVWERWNSILPDGRVSGTRMNSLNHYAYGAVCDAIYSDLAGLRRASVGWGAVTVAPHPSAYLRRADHSYQSPRGRYRSAWEVLSDGRVRVEVSVPVGCRAEVLLPDGSPAVDLGGGDAVFLVYPAKDLLHPFSERTPLCCLLADDGIRDLIARQIPEAYAMISENPEFLAEPFSFLSSLPMFGVPRETAERLTKIIRSAMPACINPDGAGQDKDRNRGVSGFSDVAPEQNAEREDMTYER